MMPAGLEKFIFKTKQIDTKDHMKKQIRKTKKMPKQLPIKLW